MRVLLAGATGYIGEAVLHELVAQGHEVVALVRPGRRLSFVLSDQRSNETPDALSDAFPDAFPDALPDALPDAFLDALPDALVWERV